jgi:hypothetical protein
MVIRLARGRRWAAYAAGALVALVASGASGVLHVTPAAAIERQAGAPCREQRRFTADEYWFWEGYLGFEDVTRSNGVVAGRLKFDPGVCFTVPESALANRIERSFGYKRAVREWIARLPRDAQSWNAGDAPYIRRRIEELLGRSFGSWQELHESWEADREFLVWSDAAKHLVVDEEAKRTNTPIASLTPVQPIAADTYWFYEGMGWFRSAPEAEGADVKVVTWTGDHVKTVRAPGTALQDRAAREAGYRKSVEEIIVDRLTIPELGAEGRAKLIERLSQLTGQSFSDTRSWTAWWMANRDKLVLAPDGQRLVVRTP